MQRPIKVGFKVDQCGPGPDVIGNAQRSSPCFRSDRTVEGLEQRQSVSTRDRKDGDLHYHVGVFAADPFGTLDGPNPGCQRIAGMYRHVHNGTALDSLPWSVRPLRVNVALKIAVVPWVRVDQAPDRSMLVSDLRLDSAPASAVASNYDFAFNVDTEFRQLLIVRRHAIVYIDQIRGDVAVRGIRVIGRQLVRVPGVGIFSDRGLLQLSDEMFRLDQLNKGFLGGRE